LPTQPTASIQHDPGRRFYVEVGDDVAYLAYRMLDERTIEYVSTFVPPALRMRRLGDKLVEHALAYAEERGLTIVPTCWFVKRVMEARGFGLP
jgi:uncharacterized protein